MLEATQTKPLHLAKEHLDLVRAILQQRLPSRTVWAFGSRATGRRVKRFSDLDLAVEGTLTWAQHADLTEAFDESLLPIKVDIVELDRVTPDFRGRIEPDLILVQTGSTLPR